MWFRPLNPCSTWFSSNPKDWPPGSFRKTHFGQHVLWHSVEGGGRHLSPANLSIYRQIGDVEVDEILRLLEKEDSNAGLPITPGEDVLARASTVHHQYIEKTSESNANLVDKALVQFYSRYATLPTWVDMDQLQRGQEVFLAYLPAISLSLYYRSLVPGFSIPHLAHVLLSTGYLAPPASRKRVQERLTDTAALLAQSMTEMAALQPKTGTGWKACLEVRILHAKVRRALLRRTRRSRSDDNENKNTKRASWDANAHGIPINEEDMAATLLAFSVNALVGAEILLGFPLPRQERLDYLALWRYLGWLLGVRVIDDDKDECDNRDNSSAQRNDLPRALDPCGPGWLENRSDSIEHSSAIFQSIIVHLLHPDESSVQVAHHLLWQGRVNEKSLMETTKTQRQEQENWFYYRCLQCRRFVGNYLADALQLPLNPKRWYRWRSWIFSSVMLTAISVYTFLALPFSPCRRFIVSFHRKHLQSFAMSWSKEHIQRVKDQLPNETKVCNFAMLFSPANQ